MQMFKLPSLDTPPFFLWCLWLCVQKFFQDNEREVLFYLDLVVSWVYAKPRPRDCHGESWQVGMDQPPSRSLQMEL